MSKISKIKYFQKSRFQRRIIAVANIIKSVLFYRVFFHKIDISFLRVLEAASLSDVRQDRCLVVGCGTGIECRYLIDLGAKEVDGIDIDLKIKEEYRGDKIKYYSLSAEDMNTIEDNKYDFIYCVATMEHIENISLALDEMIRVVKPGGILFALSSPLWFSRYGHHRAGFKQHPWIHLLFPKEAGLISYLVGAKTHSIEKIECLAYTVYHLLSNYNRLAGSFYLDVCRSKNNIEVFSNYLVVQKRPNKKSKSSVVFNNLKKRGLQDIDLLGQTHVFVAKKVA